MGHTPIKPVDDYDNPVSGGGSILTTDSTTPTPQNSPLAYVGAATVLTLKIAKNALYIILYPSTNVRYSEQASLTHYSIAPAGQQTILPCSNMPTLYVQEDSADGILNFTQILG